MINCKIMISTTAFQVINLHSQYNKISMSLNLKMKHLIFVLGALLILGSSFKIKTVTSGTFDWFPDTIYYGGDIITMDKQTEGAKFVGVKNGKITVVSDNFFTLFFYIGPNTQVVNLFGKTLTPGIVDAHSHFSLTATYLHLNFSISSAPFGNVTSIVQILQNVRDYITKYNIPAGQKVYGYGYSDQAVAEHRHPTRYDLDSVSTVHPIVLTHYTGHIVVGNSMALAGVGFTDASPNPAGGTLDRFPNGTLTGVARQYALLPLLKYSVSVTELTLEQLTTTAKLYYSCGVTTAHDVWMSMAQANFYRTLGDSAPIELNAYQWVGGASSVNFLNVMANFSTSKVTPRGAKFILDGSINGYTALLSNPYWVPESQQNDNLDNYTYNSSRSCATQQCGVNDYPLPTLLNNFLRQFNDFGYDVIAHTNGDVAIDNYLNAVAYARANSANATSDGRFVVVHAQTVRQDQLDRMLQLGAIPSYFIAQVYYWGDFHYRITLGPERANRMNPVKSSVKRKQLYTLHNDSPVVVAGFLNGRNTFIEILDAAVNRITIGGRVLGKDQRVTPYEALAGITINSAWQTKSQKIKGSITVGKNADLIILSDSPLQSKGKRIKDIQVLTTIKDGNIVFGKY